MDRIQIVFRSFFKVHQAPSDFQAFFTCAHISDRFAVVQRPECSGCLRSAASPVVSALSLKGLMHEQSRSYGWEGPLKLQAVQPARLKQRRTVSHGHSSRQAGHVTPVMFYQICWPRDSSDVLSDRLATWLHWCFIRRAGHVTPLMFYQTGWPRDSTDVLSDRLKQGDVGTTFPPMGLTLFRHSMVMSCVWLQLQRFNRKTHGFGTFSHFGPHIRNNLPQVIRQSATLSSFKSKLKTFLFTEY